MDQIMQYNNTYIGQTPINGKWGPEEVQVTTHFVGWKKRDTLLVLVGHKIEPNAMLVGIIMGGAHFLAVVGGKTIDDLWFTK